MGGDYHWYRLDNNGTWSHKPGQTGATDLDDANRPITDPRTADTGVYKFVCFMVISQNTTFDTRGKRVPLRLPCTFRGGFSLSDVAPLG